VDTAGGRLIDMRSRRDFERTSVRGALSAPAFAVAGASLAPVLSSVPDYPAVLAAALAKARPPLPPGATIVLIGPPAGVAGAEECAAALAALADAEEKAALGRPFVELEGGFAAWAAVYTPTGVPRQKGSWGDGQGGTLSFWTASN
jgi:rhodanese-related sulfurtransferase